MSIVTVHGPNTMYVSGAGGAGTAQTVTNTGGVVTADISSTRKFSFAGAGDRAAADYDWTFTGETAQANTKTGTITFSSGGAKVITLTLGTSGGTTPAGGTYTFNVDAGGATAAPRMMMPDEGGEGGPPPPGEENEYDPGEYTVAEVKEWAEAAERTDEELIAAYNAEVEGKNRTTVLSHLESLLPYDPAEYTVNEVVEYAEDNPDQLEDIIAAEEAGKNRSTLISHLEALRS